MTSQRKIYVVHSFSSTSLGQPNTKQKVLGSLFAIIFSCHYIFVHYYTDLIKLLQTLLVILLYWYKIYGICLISFFNLYELFPAFVWTNTIGSLVNRFFESRSLMFFLVLLLLHHLLVLECHINRQMLFYYFFLSYQRILHFKTEHLNHMFQEINW